MSKLSRRGLLTTGAAASLLAATGLPAAAVTPRRGGVLRVAMAHRAGFRRVLGPGAVFDTLTEIAADGTLKGELAERWDASADARVWSFTLRRGVRFHDGTGFTAEDAAATLRRHLATAGESPARWLLADVTGIRVPGPDRLQIVLAEGNPDFPFLLADDSLVITPEGRHDEALTRGIGTGLYRPTSLGPGPVAVLERVSDHYRNGEAGWFDRVELSVIADPAARMAALLRGDVDVVDDLPPYAIDTLRRIPRVQVTQVEGNGHLSFAVPDGLPDDARQAVLDALRFGLPRGAIADGALGGMASVAADHPVGAANRYLAQSVTAPIWDPERSRAVLNRAGIRRLPVDFGPLDHTARDVLAPSLTDAGLDLAPGGLSARPSIGRATEDWLFSSRPADHWLQDPTQTARFDGLRRAGRAARDSGQRREIYGQMQALLASHGQQVVPVRTPFLAAAASGLAYGPQPGKLAPLDSGRIAERWWWA